MVFTAAEEFIRARRFLERGIYNRQHVDCCGFTSQKIQGISDLLCRMRIFLVEEAYHLLLLLSHLRLQKAKNTLHILLLLSHNLSENTVFNSIEQH